GRRRRGPGRGLPGGGLQRRPALGGAAGVGVRGGGAGRAHRIRARRGQGLRPRGGADRPARYRRLDPRPHPPPRRQCHHPLQPRRGHRGPAATAEERGMIRVFLVDDHHFFLPGLRAELGAEFEIVGEAGEVDAAVDGIRRTRPDVVLLDVHLPGGGGRAVLEAVRQTDQDIRFLALSVSDAAEDVIGVIRAGARGYVTKTISPPDLAAAIRRVQGGDAVFSPRLAGFVLDAFHGDLTGVADPELDQLTAREREVLRHIARGFTYKEVARRLHLSVKTVETHVSSVLRKLQLSSRHELTRWASDRRLV